MPNLLDDGPIRIAFVGRAKVGRTFCAEYLRTEYGFTRKRLADPIDKFVKTLYFYKAKERMPWETKMKFYDAIYKIDNDLLINYLGGRMDIGIMDTAVDDVRYMNEALRLKELGFIIVRVTRPRGKETHIKKALGKDYAPGTLYLQEMYNKDFTRELGVDYSLHNETRSVTRQALDLIVDDILTNRSKNP